MTGTPSLSALTLGNETIVYRVLKANGWVAPDDSDAPLPPGTFWMTHWLLNNLMDEARREGERTARWKLERGL